MQGCLPQVHGEDEPVVSSQLPQLEEQRPRERSADRPARSLTEFTESVLQGAIHSAWLSGCPSTGPIPELRPILHLVQRRRQPPEPSLAAAPRPSGQDPAEPLGTGPRPELTEASLWLPVAVHAAHDGHRGPKEGDPDVDGRPCRGGDASWRRHEVGRPEGALQAEEEERWRAAPSSRGEGVEASGSGHRWHAKQRSFPRQLGRHPGRARGLPSAPPRGLRGQTCGLPLQAAGPRDRSGPKPRHLKMQEVNIFHPLVI